MTYIDRDFEITQEAKEWLVKLLEDSSDFTLEKPYSFENRDLEKNYRVQKLFLDSNKQIQCEAVEVESQNVKKFSLSRMSSEQFLEMVDNYIKK